jgi:DNA gyrase subunit B
MGNTPGSRGTKDNEGVVSDNMLQHPSPETPYDAAKIQVLEGLEAVRKRPSMYIGSTGLRGLHQLAFEVIDNSIDEAMAEYCNLIEVTVRGDGSLRVVDNGRGIPVDIHPSAGKPAVEVVLTVLHAGGKFDSGAYRVSGGLHGVGVSVVNALSEWLEVEVRSHGQIYRQSYERGRPVTHLEVIGSSDTTGTTITFLPDKKIFEITEFNFDTLAHRLRELAFLNKGIKICLTDERDDKSVEFLYEGGIVSFVEHLNRNKDPIHREIFYISKEINDSCVEVSLQYNDGFIVVSQS